MAGIAAGIILAIIVILALLFLMRRRSSPDRMPPEERPNGDVATERPLFEELPEEKPPAGPPEKVEVKDEGPPDDDVKALVDDIDRMLEDGPKDSPPPGPPSSPDDKKLSHFAIETERRAHDDEIEMNKK
jgi:hypothetical protein